jgi:type IV secretion system protein VirB9
LGALALLAASAGGAAAVAPHRGPGDPRIGEVIYAPDQVVELKGVLGYQMSVEFDPAERIENVAIGDGLGWQVTPNRRANLLFLKPMGRRPPTNMTVITNLRRYAFHLSVRPAPSNGRDQGVVYSLRFVYPAPVVPVVSAVAPEPPAPPKDVNHAYSYEGSAQNLPARVFDDGQSTYFQFREVDDYPAIFVVEPDGGEAVVNSFTRDSYVVVDRIARGFVLRRGTEVTRLRNDAFRESGPGPLSPKPMAKSKTWWFHR